MLAAATLVAVVAGCAVVDNRADRREAAARTEYPPEGQFVDVDGTRVHAVQAGSGPDLVLIHGASGSTRDWTFAFTERVTDRYRVTVFDRPGLGYTERLPAYRGRARTDGETPREQARLLQGAARQLGVTDPIVVGHSYGGAVALAWALEDPDYVSALVMEAGVSNPWPGSLGAIYHINSSRLGASTVVPLLTAFAPKSQARDVVETIFAPNEVPEGYMEEIGIGLSLRRKSLRANARQVNSLRPHVVEMAPHYGSIDVPVEIVHGTADDIVPMSIHSEPLAEQIPGARLTRLEGIGHMPHHVVPAEVEAAIDRAAKRAGKR